VIPNAGFGGGTGKGSEEKPFPDYRLSCVALRYGDARLRAEHAGDGFGGIETQVGVYGILMRAVFGGAGPCDIDLSRLLTGIGEHTNVIVPNLEKTAVHREITRPPLDTIEKLPNP
jgi:hypothetical protein